MKALPLIIGLAVLALPAATARAEDAAATRPTTKQASTSPEITLEDMRENLLRGKDGWLFWKGHYPAYAEESELPLKNAEVILDFAHQLKSVGILLVLVPVPDQLYLAREHWPDPKATFTRAHFERAYDSLRAKGVTVEPVAPLLEQLQAKGEKIALTQDTHLTPLAYETLAEGAAELVTKQVKIKGRPNDFNVSAHEALEPVWMAHEAKIEEMKIPVKMNRVGHATVQLLLPRPGALVLIMGDSHLSEFAGEGASFADHLSKDLGIVPDMRCRTGDATGSVLRSDLARQGDNLEGTKVLVWIFWEGALALGDEWKKIPVIKKDKP